MNRKLGLPLLALSLTTVIVTSAQMNLAAPIVFRVLPNEPQGNVYTAGETDGQLGGWSYRRYDAFVTKYGYQEKVLWKKQFGSSSDEEHSESVTINNRGNASITKYTIGIYFGRGAYGIQAAKRRPILKRR